MPLTPEEANAQELAARTGDNIPEDFHVSVRGASTANASRPSLSDAMKSPRTHLARSDTRPTS